jgi:membrane protease YdiL (CAAX protease family)
MTSPAPALTGRRVMLTLVCWLALAAVVGGVTWFAVTAFIPPWRTSQTPTLIVVAEAYAMLPVAAALVFGGVKRLATAVDFTYRGLADIAAAVAVWIVVLVTWAAIYLAWGAASGSLWQPVLDLVHKASDWSRLPHASVLDWIVIVLRVTAITGLAEELLFRGLLFGWLRQRQSFTVTVVITSVLFVLMHLYPVLAPAVFVFGLLAGWLRERRSSLLPAVLMHVLTDTTLLVAAIIISR